MEFEWDEQKRRSNIAKHDIDFEDAVEIFDGRHIVTIPSSYQLERRFLAIGELDGRIIAVVWTQRAKATRIISARRARTDEIALLHGERTSESGP